MKMWLRITLIFLNRKIKSGIRYTDDKEEYRVQMRILETVKKSYRLNGMLKHVDITTLTESHPEVQQIIRSGKEWPRLKIID